MYDQRGVLNEQIKILKRKPELLYVLQVLLADFVTASKNAKVTPLGVTMTVTLEDGCGTFDVGALYVDGKLDVLAFERQNAELNPHQCLFYLLNYIFQDFRLRSEKIQVAATALVFESLERLVEQAAAEKAAA